MWQIVERKSDLHVERDGTTKDKELALTSVIVPKSQHDEVIIDHCLVNTINISVCDESNIEKEVKGMVGTYFSKRHDNRQLAGLFRTAAPKSRVEGVNGFGKNQKEALYMCKQSMDEVKVETEDGQAEDNRRYDIENHISVCWAPPMSLPYLCHNGQHSGNDDKVKNTLSYIDPLNCKKEEVLDIATPCIWLERNLMEDCFEIIMYSKKVVKDSTLDGQGATHNFISECLVAKLELKVEDFKGFT
ncbi:hypothetical protein KI387_005291, partial [Taxus chinensis]